MFKDWTPRDFDSTLIIIGILGLATYDMYTNGTINEAISHSIALIIGTVIRGVYDKNGEKKGV